MFLTLPENRSFQTALGTLLKVMTPLTVSFKSFHVELKSTRFGFKDILQMLLFYFVGSRPNFFQGFFEKWLLCFGPMRSNPIWFGAWTNFTNSTKDQLFVNVGEFSADKFVHERDLIFFKRNVQLYQTIFVVENFIDESRISRAWEFAF